MMAKQQVLSSLLRTPLALLSAIALQVVGMPAVFGMGAFDPQAVNAEALQNALRAFQQASAAQQRADAAVDQARLAQQTARDAVNTIQGEAQAQATQAAAIAAQRVQQAVQGLVGQAQQYAAQADRLKDQASGQAQAAAEQAGRAAQAVNTVQRAIQQHDNAINAQLDNNRREAAADRARDHQDHTRALQQLNAEQQRRLAQLKIDVEAAFRQAALDQTRETETLKADMERAREQEKQERELRLHASKLQLDRDSQIQLASNAQIRQARVEEQVALKKAELESPAYWDAKNKEIELNARATEKVAELQKESAIEVATMKWGSIKEMFNSLGSGFTNLSNDPKRMAKLVAAIAATTVAIYGVKHGMPVLISHLVQPRVVSETSKVSWFGWTPPQSDININNLMFGDALEAQLHDLALQVQTAKQFDENLPNVMFYGAPGTGKTAFARALAYASGLDYALTSGSEFAKITDLNQANNELRKLITWAQTTDKGLIVFIDEAESLFANRKLPTTPKHVQDFINTFLALIPEKSQKGIMFIFATNHPFKLDDAMTGRVGVSIEFEAPDAAVREKILGMYLEQFAAKNKEALIEISPEVTQHLADYARELEGSVPRAIKFIAEQMVIRARRQADKTLRHDVAQAVLHEAKLNIEQTNAWAAEREVWLASQLSGHHVPAKAAAAA